MTYRTSLVAELIQVLSNILGLEHERFHVIFGLLQSPIRGFAHSFNRYDLVAVCLDSNAVLEFGRESNSDLQLVASVQTFDTRRGELIPEHVWVCEIHNTLACLEYDITVV